MNKTIPISVLMTAYNAEQFIGEAISSVLNQSFCDFEFIIINDGSTDKTAAIIESFKDSRIAYIQQENKGLATALNCGLAKAKGKYIARFDADDICYEHRLEKQYKFMLQNPDHIIVSSSVDYIDQHGEFVFNFSPAAYSNEEIQRIRNKVCPFIHSGVLYKKDIVLSKGGYNEHAHCFEDHLLWLAIIEEGKAFNFHEPLMKVRLNPLSVSIDERWRPKEFHRIKTRAIQNMFISEEDGRQLLRIIKGQNIKKIKEGAYHSLLAKKFLWNNYQPQKARQNLRKAIRLDWRQWKSYCLFALSFLPRNVLYSWYKIAKSETRYQTKNGIK